MPIWKRNLIVCWFGTFVTSIGMSQIAPVLPLYIKHLGVDNTALVAQLAGVTFGITFIMSAIFSPIWGQAADRFGRKPMLLRASLGMAIIIGCMGFAHNVYELIALRTLQGVVTGFATACTALVATQTDEAHAGWALGTLSTGAITGSLLGPLVGGIIAEHFGLQNVFFMTGGLLFAAFILTALFVKENFVRSEKKVMNTKEVWRALPNKSFILTMFVTFFTLTLALYSVEPIITVYMQQLSRGASHIALLSGLAFSASGLASIIAAPRLGKLSDKIGAQRVIFVALIVAGVVFIPQAFVNHPWELIALRFILGLAVAGLNPSVNILIKKMTPPDFTGRVFGITNSAGYLGIFMGSVFGGQIEAWLGIQYVFFITSALLFVNAVWVYFKVYKKLNVKHQLVKEQIK
ncbi:MFS transporter [Listeria sp. SHR_NRA_18]|uniref:multidrug efflux MFS transporter n=1 Tax=Listeria sp. SHR_NRA_18 TaxID=2269046 RepID=UPI00051DE7A8|nr:multidrug efflux MFS transporter [Listeria sp. SHR_NRA_18]KGL39418.1 MFS transporter [Listeriaceae bacterium FSL A5-0209]RQW66971.1 MFS transporter [Listeria sp. SHR_NRA_18]